MNHAGGVVRTIERLASRQFGAFSRDQAIEVGVTRRMLEHRLQSGQWELVAPRAYRVVAVPVSYRQRAMAAILWAAPDGLISHQSAAALWTLEGIARTRSIHVTLPTARRIRGREIIVHSSSQVIAVDRATVGPIRTTSGLRTVLDVAATLDALTLEIAIEDALRRRLFTVGQLEWRASSRSGSGIAGSSVIRELLAFRGLGQTDSGWELRVARVLTEAGFPEPSRQLAVPTALGDLHVDLGYPGPPVVAFEYDSDRWHSGVRRRHHDASRRNALRAAGVLVVEITPVLVRNPTTLIELARQTMPAFPHAPG